ncbi:MAG: patatin-like phospholipase family protein [Bacteroidia bacterium]|nr:patatin-like phospholipase family protein [Bacteroidia bacterium]
MIQKDHSPPETNTKYNCGIVLSGGGARGFAHVGVLKALNENGIYPEIISAVSAGSIVGVLYADGYTPDEIFQIFSKIDIYKILRFYRPAFGVLKAEGLEKTLLKYLRARKFEDLKFPLYISATNFTKANTVYFNSGALIPAVMASSAIPMILKPVLYQNDYFVDGGLMNNLPVEPLEGVCKHIIGVNVNPVSEVKQFSSFRNFADRVLHLAVRANVQQNIDKCTVYLEPPGLMEYHIFKVSSSEQIFKLGYEYAISIMDTIKESLHKKTNS